MIKKKKHKTISRRDFIKTLGAGAMAAKLCHRTNILGRAHAAENKLKVLKLSHWFPDYDDWYMSKFVKEWEDRYGIEVELSISPDYRGYKSRTLVEAISQHGHDIVQFTWPFSAYEEYVIDHREIVEEVEKKYGKMYPFAKRSICNPNTQKYFGFPVSFSPNLVSYRKDLWDEAGYIPDTWDNTRVGGAKIKEISGNPVGIGLSQVDDSTNALLAIMYSFGSLVQDQNHKVAINSKNTIEALKYVQYLYHDAMAPDVFTWDNIANNKFMLEGISSLAMDDITIARVAEKKELEVKNMIFLAKPTEGPESGVAPYKTIQSYAIWNFSQNKGAAKQFLIDFIEKSESAFIASKYYDIPIFPKLIPELDNIISTKSENPSPNKYRVLKEASVWTTNIGYPGYSTKAISYVYDTWVIPIMFSQVVSGMLTFADAARDAEKKVKLIFEKLN